MQLSTNTDALNGVTSAPPHPSPLPHAGGEGWGEGVKWSVTGINAFILVYLIIENSSYAGVKNSGFVTQGSDPFWIIGALLIVDFRIPIDEWAPA